MPAPKRICGCGCGRLVSKSTEERHRAGVAPTSILATQILNGLRSAGPTVSTAPRPSKRQRTEAPARSSNDPIQLPPPHFAPSAPQDSEFDTNTESSCSFCAEDLPGQPPQTSPMQNNDNEELVPGLEELMQPSLHCPRAQTVSDYSEEEEGEDVRADVACGAGEEDHWRRCADFRGTVGGRGRGRG